MQFICSHFRLRLQMVGGQLRLNSRGSCKGTVLRQIKNPKKNRHNHVLWQHQSLYISTCYLFFVSINQHMSTYVHTNPYQRSKLSKIFPPLNYTLWRLFFPSLSMGTNLLSPLGGIVVTTRSNPSPWRGHQTISSPTWRRSTSSRPWGMITPHKGTEQTYLHLHHKH